MKWLEGGLLSLLVLLVVFMLYRQHEIDMTLNRVVQRADSLMVARRDSIIIVEKYIREIERKAKDDIATVRNTRSADSLIILYWRFRPSTSLRQRYGGD